MTTSSLYLSKQGDSEVAEGRAPRVVYMREVEKGPSPVRALRDASMGRQGALGQVQHTATSPQQVKPGQVAGGTPGKQGDHLPGLGISSNGFFKRTLV